MEGNLITNHLFMVDQDLLALLPTLLASSRGAAARRTVCRLLGHREE